MGISFPFEFTTISKSTFEGCSSLSYIMIGKLIETKKIKEIFVSSYSKIQKIVVLSLTKMIIDNAFEGCSSLKFIVLPYGITSIGHFVFSDCSSLTHVTIPSSVTSIRGDSFSGCSSLEKIDVNSGHFSNYQSDGILYDVNIKTLVICPQGRKNISILNRISRIDDYAFFGCQSITTITLPVTVTTIGQYAFSGCSSLTSISIPNSVTSFGEYAFSECSSLKSFTFPKSVITIGDCIFEGCDSLKKIMIPRSFRSTFGDHQILQYY